MTAYNRRLNVPAACPVVNVGSQKQPVYLPAEVCEVLPGQIFGGEPDPNMRSNMIKFSCRRPPQNYASIMSEGLDIMGISNDRTREVGIKPSTQMITVPARILNAPNLLYAKKATKVAYGSWNLIRTKFSEGAAIKSWTCVWVRKRGTKEPFKDPDQEMGTLFKKLREHGLTLPPPSKPYHTVELVNPAKYPGNSERADVESRQLLRGKLEILKKEGFDLLVVLLPTTESKTFDYIKYIGDVKVGVLTHCMLAEKFCGANEQYISNNAMKINLKMGGCNQLLEASGSKFISQGKTMIVGLDVTHPTTTDAEEAPSIAAIVASIDGRMGQWPGEVRGQTRRQESIEHLAEMIEARIRIWIRRNKQPPSNILIYRDGVSEGQFQMVLKDELKLVIAGCKKVTEYSKRPNITVIVCGKRHHVRFYPTQQKDQDRSQNPINGSVVDRGVTRPSYWDFYLQAQSPLQGSARPAHYIVVHDEIFTNSQITPGSKPADLVQELTHNICYMMGRATRSISYATPAFLADRLCDRARKYLLAHLHSRNDPISSKDKDTVMTCVRTDNQFPRSMVYI
jgi:eukaryotic translation initiation factor 2C